MCGIAGILRFDPPACLPGEIERMTAALAHRGPDDQGVLTRAGVALGHRRLSIIDLAGGHQPMANEDQQVWIVFNGEIYNYRELRPQLEQAGHRFASHSDTEVILHAYEQWGESCVERLRGMFAFAIADFRQQRLFLARDHLGIKPLLYRVGRGYVAFASELQALRQVNDSEPTGSITALDAFLRCKYIPQPDTVFHEIHKLAPGNRLTIDFTGSRPEPQSYYQPRLAPPASAPWDEAAWLERFEHTVRESVQAHLVSDVPFGVFLSGGIDSTLVAWYMSELLERPVKAFSIGFAEPEFCELRYAQQAARELGVEQHTQVVEPKVADLLPTLMQHYGEPFADSSAVPTWYVCQLARQYVPMVLSGDGGDELFAGYGRYGIWQQQGLAHAAYRLARGWTVDGETWRSIARRLTHPREKRLEFWAGLMSNFLGSQRRNLWRPEHHHQLDRPLAALVAAAELARDDDPLAFVQTLDVHTYLPGDILTKVDIASMCHGLEARTPLVDRVVLDFAAAVPIALRCAGRGRSRVLKHLPKLALTRRLGRAFVDRPKMGFGIPQEQWLLPGAPLRPLLEETVLSPRARLHEFLRAEEVRRQVDANDKGRGNSYIVWMLLTLGVWLAANPRVTFR